MNTNGGTKGMKRLGLTTLVLALANLSTTGLANTGIDSKLVLSPAVYYTTANSELKTTTGKQTSKSALLSFNIGAGYGFGGGVFAGVKYISDSNDEVVEVLSSSQDEDHKTSAAGLSVGYFISGFLGSFSYMIVQGPTKTVGTSKYEGSKGYVLDGAYFIDLGGWMLGPQFTYRSFEYDSLSVNGVKDESFESLKDDRLYPYLAFMVAF